MRRWAFFLVALLLAAALDAMPFRGTDVADLQPVELVYVRSEQSRVFVQTDTGDVGTGETIDAAFEDMKKSAPSEIFLDTAEHLLLAPSARSLLPELADILRPACTVCIVQTDVDLEQAAEFLGMHKPTRSLTDCRAGKLDIPTLKLQEGRMYLVP